MKPDQKIAENALSTAKKRYGDAERRYSKWKRECLAAEMDFVNALQAYSAAQQAFERDFEAIGHPDRSCP